MNKHLLLVDDEENILQSMLRLLRHEAYKVLTATSGEAALKLLEEHEVQVILSDQRMPGMTGADLLYRSRLLCPETIRILCSGYTDFDAVTAMINRGSVFKFLAKPFDDELLRVTIREAFQRYDLDRKGAQFTKIYENTSEGIIITDGECRVMAVNPALSTITGYREDELVGQTLACLYAGRQWSDFFRRLWRSLHGSGSWNGEFPTRHKDGTVSPQLLNIDAIRDSCDHIREYVGLFTDISKHKEAERKLRYQAYHDPLTGLPNRLMYTEHLEVALAQAGRRHKMCGVLLLDLDHFKYVNDTYGHEFGDRLLVLVAQRLCNTLRKEDVLARLGGDEFTIMLPLLDSVKDVSRVASKILVSLATPFAINGRELYVTASIGIAVSPDNGHDVETLLKNADVAMYRAKEGGRNLFRFFSADMNTLAQRRLELEHDLRRALDRSEMEVYYQPKFSLATESIIGAEALLRWHYPARGLVLPGEFIPLAEEIGYISTLGEWTLSEVCRQIRCWQEQGLGIPRIAINLSCRQVQCQNLPEVFGRIIGEAGISPGALEFELTEGTIMSNPDACRETLQLFKQLGITIAIDDFGVGYSSLNYLRYLPLDVVKIDRSFIHDLLAKSGSSELVQGIIEMAHALRLEVVAEGVETAEQLSFLRQHHCDMIQGFLFSPAVTSRDFATLLREERARCDDPLVRCSPAGDRFATSQPLPRDKGLT